MKELEPGDSEYLRTSFLERIAHELRGPPGVIDGAVQELEAALGERVGENRALIEMIRRGIRKLARTADRLQQTGLCERAQLDLEVQRCDLANLVRTSVQEATSTEGRKMIRVQVDVPVDPRICELDERWIGIAVYEIASNAIRHARELVTVSLEQDDDAFQVSFVDDNRNAIEFEPLRFRAPREARGLGLALAIVRDVITAHGGSLRIERAENGNPHGDNRTRVSIRLPHAREGKPAATEAHA